MRGLPWVFAGVAFLVPSWVHAQPTPDSTQCGDPTARAEHWDQGCRSPEERRARRFYWLAISGIGSLHFNSSSQLNAALRGSGYSAPGFAQSIFGGGFDGGIGRFRATWDLGCPGSRSYTRISDGASFRVRQCYIGLDLGYDVVQLGGLAIFPMLGIAGGDLRLKVDANQPPFLADQLSAADRNGEIRRNVGAARLLIGIEQRVLIWESERMWLLFGVRAGYVQQIGQSNWLHEGRNVPKLQGGPAVDTSGPCLRLSIGLAADTD